MSFITMCTCKQILTVTFEHNVDVRMTGEWRVENDINAYVHSLIDILSQHLVDVI